jgi:hypothetical protein
MLIWGSQGEVVDLGRVENRHCETCEKDRPFKIFLQYTSCHLWYIFRWVTNKRYLFLCDVCRRRVELDTNKIEASLEKNPISWYQRYSWTILIGMILFALGGGLLASMEKEKNNQAYVQTPNISDIYVVNTNIILKDSNSAHSYCAFRVKNISQTRVEFELSSVCYNKSKGVDRDITAGKARVATYYDKETIFVPLSELKTWRAKGAIIDIYRL